jgi:hypothetical protein
MNLAPTVVFIVGVSPQTSMDGKSVQSVAKATKGQKRIIMVNTIIFIVS